MSNRAALPGLSSAKLATRLLAIGTFIPEPAIVILLIHKNNTDSLFGETIHSNFLLPRHSRHYFANKTHRLKRELLDYLLLFALGSSGLLYMVMNDHKTHNI